MDLLVLGVSHKTASAQVRDEVQMHPEEMGSFYSRLRKHSDLIREAVVLSTCNRTEFYGFTKDRIEADQAFRDGPGRDNTKQQIEHRGQGGNRANQGCGMETN